WPGRNFLFAYGHSCRAYSCWQTTRAGDNRHDTLGCAARNTDRERICAGLRETSYWIGLGAPKNTPVEIIGKLNTEINAALADPGLKLRFADLGGSVVGGSADDFEKLVSDETDKWGRVVRAAHIKAE